MDDIQEEKNGNGYERVELSMPGALAHAKSGWIFEFEETVLDLDPDSYSSTRIKITAPRRIEPKYHMEMHDFSVLAISHYSSYQVKDGVLEEPLEYETGIFVQVNGIDFVYIPWMWAITIYIIMAILLFNLGINPFVMRRRKVKEPGFVALYRVISNPERRAQSRARREERRQLRRELKEKERLDKELKKDKEVQKAKTPPPEKERPAPKRSAPVLDLHRTEDDFDIELPAASETHVRKPQRRSGPLLGGKPRKRDVVEKDMLDVLSSLDD